MTFFATRVLKRCAIDFRFPGKPWIRSRSPGNCVSVGRGGNFHRSIRDFFLQIYRVREVRRVATVRRPRLSGGKLARAYGFPFRSFATRYEAFLGPLHARGYHQVLSFSIARSTRGRFAILVAYQQQDRKILFTFFRETIGNVRRSCNALPVDYAFPDRRGYLRKLPTTSLERELVFHDSAKKSRTSSLGIKFCSYAGRNALYSFFFIGLRGQGNRGQSCICK